MKNETYERNRYEVHASHYYEASEKPKPQGVPESGGWNPTWTVYRRNAKTIEEARQQIAEEKKIGASLAWLISLGKCRFRIVKVTATCEVVE